MAKTGGESQSDLLMGMLWIAHALTTTHNRLSSTLMTLAWLLMVMKKKAGRSRLELNNVF
jgi:hypothetical protein